MSAAVDDYIKQNESRFLEELFSFIRIPSVSTLPEHKADVAKAADFVAEALRSVGIERVEVIKTARHPLVYGDWLHAPGKPTVLCYGHYDVQPPDPLELWETRPSTRGSATAISMHADRPTTKARCTCISKRWKCCGRRIKDGCRSMSNS